MDKSVAGLNIAHYRKLLATELDATKRKAIEMFLASEETKLAEITAERRKKAQNLGKES